jgi:hypothetical protein
MTRVQALRRKLGRLMLGSEGQRISVLLLALHQLRTVFMALSNLRYSK